MSLAQQSCVPCRGGMAPLDRGRAEELLKEIPQWSLDEGATRISRTFKFKDFAQALDFVNGIGRIAEEQTHHPDIAFGWGYATVTLYTHKIKGLHENDFIVAAKADRLFGDAQRS